MNWLVIQFTYLFIIFFILNFQLIIEFPVSKLVHLLKLILTLIFILINFELLINLLSIEDIHFFHLIILSFSIIILQVFLLIIFVHVKQEIFFNVLKDCYDDFKIYYLIVHYFQMIFYLFEIKIFANFKLNFFVWL
jgi:hypothetical protein